MSEPQLSDLDRCFHGRHSIDTCLDCPNGQSTGNMFLTNGQRIGTTLYGDPIYVATRREPRNAQFVGDGGSSPEA